jgi:ribosome maturation factor RimP
MEASVGPTEWAKAHFFVGCGHCETMGETLASKIGEIAQRVVDSEGIELVEVEVKGGGNQRFVRISIDKPSGVTHADCELVSQQVGTILDVEDVVRGGRYTLEVSSPGIERKLVKSKDYERFQGRKIRAVLREPVENQRHWEGTVAGISGDIVTLQTDSGKTIEFRFDQVQKANLKHEW